MFRPNCTGPDTGKPSPYRTLSRALQYPARIAFCHLPCSLILVLICVFNGLVNMILSSLGSVYQTVYHFPATTAGLSYLGMGIGGLLALALAKRLTNLLARRVGGPDGEKKPENALPFLFLVSPVGSAGLLWYGWSLQSQAHWIVPILGLFLFGFTYMSVRVSLLPCGAYGFCLLTLLLPKLCTQIFMVEAVPNYPASALAAHTVASSVGGAILPLSTFPLYGRAGYGWGNTVIAMVNLGIYSIPVSMFVLSRRLGDKWKMEVAL